MASGFDVQIAGLTRSADAADDAARRMGALDPGECLRGAGAGIPGAAAVALLGEVAVAWREEFTTWERDARGYAVLLDRSAETYRHSDQAAAQDFALLDREAARWR